MLLSIRFLKVPDAQLAAIRFLKVPDLLTVVLTMTITSVLTERKRGWHDPAMLRRGLSLVAPAPGPVCHPYAASARLSASAPSSIAPATTANAARQADSCSGCQAEPAIAAIAPISASPTTG